jgi:hypothetical protein
MSAFVLLLAAGVVPGDGPGEVSAETERGLDLRGEWECVHEESLVARRQRMKR